MDNCAKTILDALNETGIPFVEDAWLDENADNGRSDYGVVEVAGVDNLYGDDRLVNQQITGNVILYVMDGQDDKARMVQDALMEIDGITVRPFRKEFVQDLMANRWTWGFRLEEGLI